MTISSDKCVMDKKNITLIHYPLYSSNAFHSSSAFNPFRLIRGGDRVNG